MELSVIRNLPLEKSAYQQSFPFPTENKNIILYQGAVNIGRGIELMLEPSNLQLCIGHYQLEILKH